MQATLGQEFGRYIKMPEMIARVASSLDIGTAELVKTQEELQAEQAAQQEAEMAQAAVAPSINAASKPQG